MNYLRGGERVDVEFPVEVEWKGRGGKQQHIQGKTATMSGNGLYMVLPIQLRDNTPITVTVSLPVELTKTPIELLCEGRVVRSDQPGTPAGVGAIIDDYQFRPAKRMD